MTTAALIVAAGRGTRAGGGLPKQWRALAGRRVADWTLAAFANHPAIDRVLVVIHPSDAAHLPSDMDWVPGGATRAASVRAGLEALAGEDVTAVLIHDMARACVSANVITDVAAALEHNIAAAPGLDVTDALWTKSGALISGTQPRDGLARAQTPQGFRFPDILAAHRSLSVEAADDVEVALKAGLNVACVPGDPDNIKITTAGDFERAARILGGQMDVRLGNGYDVHRFCDGDAVILCGVRIPFDKALDGHSDADVGMHAVTDAIYGALADGDIGQHFPPSDPQWKGAASALFLHHAVDLAQERGYRIGNIDLTLVCELPKIGPHATAMRERMSAIMAIGLDRISIKATTSERLGFTGREEGIAAIATATLVKP